MTRWHSSPSSRSGSEPSIFGDCTNTRRFEAVFQALSLDEEGIDKELLKDLGRLRKSAGKVRDMDVLTAFASNVHPRGEEECLVKLLEHLGAQRKKQAGKLSAEAIEKLAKAAKSTPEEIEFLKRVATNAKY